MYGVGRALLPPTRAVTFLLLLLLVLLLLCPLPN